MDAENMTAWGTIALAIISFLALIVSGISILKSIASEKISQAANDLSASAKNTAEQAFKNSQGDSEILIHNSISEALKMQDECSIRLIEAKEKYNFAENQTTEAYQKLLDSAIQGLLNAYDIACQRYLDQKLDQERFRKTYSKRINELFDSQKPYKVFIQDESSTKYHALHKVNKEFNNLE
ncbi:MULTISPECIES: hypothetical protein [Pectobacteriaceae]|uniref:hypothetical protein n=1 Tax=Pectobacteriaceae TaxID=1903410 RepID=UPI0005B2F143|nr:MULTISPECIES: hypothetical protein [Pectobacteriaceae]MCA6928670.1 hypothetical protein [Pectobacterium versatile]MCH5085414.1 hypothetical protein [Pectobacterium versatile]